MTHKVAADFRLFAGIYSQRFHGYFNIPQREWPEYEEVRDKVLEQLLLSDVKFALSQIISYSNSYFICFYRFD